MTPISARSYQEKKLTINQQLEKTLNNMKTPTAGQAPGTTTGGGMKFNLGITPTAGNNTSKMFGAKLAGMVTPSANQNKKL